ncbi:MAG TPA: PEP-CTERM sorting domain-containing protein [Myxococcota bacterium]|nr:PEP-CTERM sorting domain-containing protein [Myxococcota bacterium]
MRKLKMFALGAVLVGASAANAGQLISATYTQTLQGVPLELGTPNGGVATGTLVGNSFTLDAGSAFATDFCIVNPGATSCPTGFTTAPPVPTGPVVDNPGGPFAAPVVGLNVTFTMNGAIAGTLGQGDISPASGVMGLVRVMAKFGKVAPSFTLIPVPVNAGVGATVTLPDPATSPSPSLQVQIRSDVWHIGAVTQTGLTSDFTAIPDVMATGSVNVTAGGNTVVNLVSLGRLRVRGLANSETSSPTFLRLEYAADGVPEPGTLALLGAGVAGLVMIGRRKLQ